MLCSTNCGRRMESKEGGMDTLVKKSLQPAASASCRSLCNELAVRATMITGLLNISVFMRWSSALVTPTSAFVSPEPVDPTPLRKVGVVEALPEKTPMLFNLSSLRISFVASNPFMTGSWMSMRTKWKPPARHFVTASRPFMAVCHRTFRRFMKASSNRRLIMLSSTMRTFIGGTAPSRSPAGSFGGLSFVLRPGFCVFRGRGEETRGGGLSV